jgi:glutamyl-tRNA(Gln) amidotransferase subunit E
VVKIRNMKEMSPADYSEIGFKSGLEIHQQLDTEKKLFCRCPVRPYSEQYHAEILRHMRPTLSELGEYDGTALMEFKTKKEIIYQIHKDTVCTYEMDDTPPFEINRKALDIALEISMLLNCNLVSEIHIARKQYLDGSIPTGFQRTTILGVDGWIPYKEGRIGVIQLGLEEDACREVGDRGHIRKYRTDRLGIPLVETVTYPHMKTPEEVAEVAQMIRWLTRSTGKVRRGYGSARQDVNVSVEGGQRVEIKGVPRIPLIPLLVHNEAFRQLNLLEIALNLSNRGIDTSNFQADISNITTMLRGTQYSPIAEALAEGLEAKCVLIKGYKDILSTVTQPETTFSKEISDRVRVIACLDKLPNMIHSDMKGETLSPTEWSNLKRHTNTGEKDVLVIVWGNTEDVATAAREVVIRAREALEGVPNETRQALSDGTNGFERILPGPDRMYPDTDLPPLAISARKIEEIHSNLPEPPYHREERYKNLGLSPDIAREISISEYAELFDQALETKHYSPVFLADFIINRLRGMIKKGDLPSFTHEIFLDSLDEAGKNNLHREAFTLLVEATCGPDMIIPSEAAGALTPLDPSEHKEEIISTLNEINHPPFAPGKLKRYLMKYLTEKWGGRIKGRELSEMVEQFISEDKAAQR